MTNSSPCPACGAEVLDIDLKCAACGAALNATGAQRMLGQVMLGHYELVDVLGQGGMSVVFHARHQLTGQEVALKILPPELAAHSQVKSRFVEEARALAALDHPNIVHLYTFGAHDGAFVLAMQYVQGRTWERLIVENGRLDWRTACQICVDVLRALEYAHGRGVIHRDMKPSNVLVREADGAATVMDFGIAKMTTSTRLTATGQTMGTVRYMSPEQVRGREVDPRTDLYSLGATMYEALTGETPFDGDTHFEIMTRHLNDPPRPLARAGGSDVPRAVEDLVMRCLAKAPADRPSARDMRVHLEAALRTRDLGTDDTAPRLPPLAPRPDAIAATGAAPVATMTSRVRGRRRMVILASVVAAAGIAVAAALLVRRAPTPAVLAIGAVRLPLARSEGGLLIATDGSLAVDALATAYRDELARLRAWGTTRGVALPAQDPVHELLALPAAALCDPAAYLDGAPPGDCASAAFTLAVSPHNRTRLYVVADPARLAEALHRGVPQAVCSFTPADRGTPEGERRFHEICELTRTYVDNPLNTHE